MPLEVPSQALVGTAVLAKTALATAAASVATAVVSGGLIGVFFVPRKQYVVLTDRRLLFVEMNQVTGRPMPNLVGELPRSALKAGGVRGRVTPVLIISVAGEAKGLKLRFPWPVRRDAHTIAAALGTPVIEGHGLDGLP
jgi:hypothetical protein